MYKKGVSEVVTAILLILLAVAAVIIVWTVVKPLIVGVGPKIEASCINVELKVSAVDSTSATKTVTVKNTGTVDVDAVRITVQDANGGTPFDTTTGLLALETKAFTVASPPVGAWTEVDVAGKKGGNLCPVAEFVLPLG